MIGVQKRKLAQGDENARSTKKKSRASNATIKSKQQQSAAMMAPMGSDKPNQDESVWIFGLINNIEQLLSTFNAINHQSNQQQQQQQQQQQSGSITPSSSCSSSQASSPAQPTQTTSCAASSSIQAHHHHHHHHHQGHNQLHQAQLPRSPISRQIKFHEYKGPPTSRRQPPQQAAGNQQKKPTATSSNEMKPIRASQHATGQAAKSNPGSDFQQKTINYQSARSNQLRQQQVLPVHNNQEHNVLPNRQHVQQRSSMSAQELHLQQQPFKAGSMTSGPKFYLSINQGPSSGNESANGAPPATAPSITNELRPDKQQHQLIEGATFVQDHKLVDSPSSFSLNSLRVTQQQQQQNQQLQLQLQLQQQQQMASSGLDNYSNVSYYQVPKQQQQQQRLLVGESNPYLTNENSSTFDETNSASLMQNEDYYQDSCDDDLDSCEPSINQSFCQGVDNELLFSEFIDLQNVPMNVDESDWLKKFLPPCHSSMS